MAFKSNAKEEFYRCVLANGTVAFQEQKCFVFDRDQSKKPVIKNTKPQQKKNKTNIDRPTVSSEPIKRPQRKIRSKELQKIANVSSTDQSKQVIMDHVKSYQMSIEVLKRWSMFKKVYNNKLLHMKFKDSGMSLLIDFIFPDNKRFSDRELTEIIQLVGSQYVKSSYEEEVNIRRLPVAKGSGMIATFTHYNNSDYKHTTKGVIFKNDWLIQFTLLSNDLQSYSHQFAIKSLAQSITISKD